MKANTDAMRDLQASVKANAATIKALSAERSASSNSSAAEKHHYNRPPRFQKLGFPRYDGNSEPLIFINSCDTYFRQERIMEEEKVWMASCHLDDGARTWFLQIQEEGTPTWRRFTELLHRRFKSPPCPNLLHRVALGIDNSLRILDEVSTLLDRLRARLEAKDKEDRERRAAVRLQAAVRGLLARRRAQALRATKASKEQSTVRLQAAGRGFLVRRVVRKMRMLLSSSLSCVFVPSAPSIHQAAPIAGEV
jgi:hypothetical protein